MELLQSCLVGLAHSVKMRFSSCGMSAKSNQEPKQPRGEATPIARLDIGGQIGE